MPALTQTCVALLNLCFEWHPPARTDSIGQVRNRRSMLEGAPTKTNHTWSLERSFRVHVRQNQEIIATQK